ncbi:hypothetical protein BIV25_43140 [Streptomyces sp. MUSC 14]|uniref:CGNR zinc finger domain-containing protein n=1 Tax=Streptomyces sp. MUSC 14 TaxID=1354889 RepID=UPI0008F5E596|nr:CGNR zinc finger domain-containing protein [Streptomyces sp. MUSC 14]OIJ85772.1 hypothetical protein BIV25_43140 [Streptomyces sp. MUSC 14]
MSDRERQDDLLELLNTTPLDSSGRPTDLLAEPHAAKEWQCAHGGTGAASERRHLLEARDALQAVVRGTAPATALSPLLEGVASRPKVSPEGIAWEMDVPRGRELAVRALVTWSCVQETMPGRLRPCANPECRLFLLDRSKPNKARWCSMAVCGNRMKVRRHYERSREGEAV